MSRRKIAIAEAPAISVCEQRFREEPIENNPPIRLWNGKHRFSYAGTIGVAFLVFLLLASWPVSAIGGQATDGDLAPLEQSNGGISRTSVPEELTAYSVVHLDHVLLARQADKFGQISLAIDGTTLQIVLTPTQVSEMSARAPCKLYDTVSCRHFAGYVDGDQCSSVRISFDENGLSGWVRTSTNEWFIEPALQYDSGALPGTELMFKSTDRTRPPGPIDRDLPPSAIVDMANDSSASTEDQVPTTVTQTYYVENATVAPGSGQTMQSSLASTSTPLTQGSTRVLRFIAVADDQFRSIYGSTWRTYIENRINEINGWYTQVGIQILIVRPSDPWAHSNSNEDDLRNYLLTCRDYVRAKAWVGYDECNLFAGEDTIGGAIGTSYIRGAGTGLFGDSTRTTWGFTAVCMYKGYTDAKNSEHLAHEIGHTLNGVHDQTDPYFQDDEEHYPPRSTIMGYSNIIWHWFSHGNNTPPEGVRHNNAQRISAWAIMNLHQVWWTQPGGNYGNYPNDRVRMTNFKARVLDIPGPTNTVVNVQFDLTWDVGNPGDPYYIVLSQVYPTFYSPTGVNHDFSRAYNVKIYSRQTFHYNSDNYGGGSCTLGEYGQWRMHACYYFNGHWGTYYGSDTIWINRYYVLANTAPVQADMDSPVVRIVGVSNTAVPTLLCWNFQVLCYKSQPHVGDTVDVFWGAFNTADQVYRADGAYFSMIASCKSPAGPWRDFGTMGTQNWVQRSSEANGDQFDDLNQNGIGNPAGGAVMFLATSYSFDVTGTWRLFPELYSGGAWPAWYAAEYDFNVLP